jgi:hypothetical protein
MFKTSTFVITHLNTRASTFVTGTEQYGHGEPTTHSAVTAQITLSSVNLNLATRGVDWCHALQNETLLQSFDVFLLPKQICILLKINFNTS